MGGGGASPLSIPFDWTFSLPPLRWSWTEMRRPCGFIFVWMEYQILITVSNLTVEIAIKDCDLFYKHKTYMSVLLIIVLFPPNT